jgi:hypothetical protein
MMVPDDVYHRGLSPPRVLTFRRPCNASQRANERAIVYLLYKGLNYHHSMKYHNGAIISKTNLDQILCPTKMYTVF